jgi:hypothetical protein
MSPDRGGRTETHVSYWPFCDLCRCPLWSRLLKQQRTNLKAASVLVSASNSSCHPFGQSCRHCFKISSRVVVTGRIGTTVVRTSTRLVPGGKACAG